MKIKAVLNDLEGLDDSLKQYYAEKDGKFYLSLEGVQEHPETQALKGALDRVRKEKSDVLKERDELKDKYGSLPEDFNLEEYNALKDKGAGDVDERLKEQKDRLTKQFDTEKEKLIGERDKWKNGFEKEALEKTLSDSIAELNIAKPFIPAVKAMFKGRINIAHEGEELVSTIDSMPVKDAMKAWADSEDGKHYVSADKNSGGGALGGGKGIKDTKNPFNKDAPNLTEQMRIQREDPQKAERLKKEAQ